MSISWDIKIKLFLIIRFRFQEIALEVDTLKMEISNFLSSSTSTNNDSVFVTCALLTWEMITRHLMLLRMLRLGNTKPFLLTFLNTIALMVAFLLLTCSFSCQLLCFAFSKVFSQVKIIFTNLLLILLK